MAINKKDLSEEDIKYRYITPAIENAGWNKDQVRMEYFFTDGMVNIINSGSHVIGKRKKADYLLSKSYNYPIAIVEAKDNSHAVGDGIQQAMGYAEILDVPFAYSSNGDGFLEHDFLTGQERYLKMDEFPTMEELIQRIADAKGLTTEGQKMVDVPYYVDADSHELRYYQRIAVNRTVEAVAKGQRRLLIVMATGTGKTITAFQIIHRLHDAGLKKILYLADRNILIDQTMTQDFKPFSKIMTKVKSIDNGNGEIVKIDTAYEIYMALYQQLVATEESGLPNPFTEVSPDYFDLIVVDECHRGSAKDDSAWRQILEYFNSAVQIGMTATPKAAEGANNLEYFGQPIYTYSLLQGIQDGFLAPYAVTKSFLDIDMNGYTPEEGDLDINNNEILLRFYDRKDIGRNIAFIKRRIVVASRITKMLHEIGRMTKTIVFCSDTEEALEMRRLLVNMNADMCQKDPRYVMRITGNDKEGVKQLDNFIDVDEPYPTIVTTSEMLSTGVDCKTCGLIVIDKEIESMTEFKQIIGRGTRLRKDKNKFHLEILDFRNATSKFSDPEFDGDPIPTKSKPRSGNGPKPYDIPGEEGDGTEVHEEHVKYVIGDGVQVRIQTEIVSYLGADGKTLRTESFTDFTKNQILKRYSTMREFIDAWNNSESKTQLVEELKENCILVEGLRESNIALANADIFDIICHVAYDQKPLTRKERANNVKKRNYLAKYEGKAREILEILLEMYSESGILNIEKDNIFSLPQFEKFGSPVKIAKILGGIQVYQQVIKDFENEIYITA